MIMAQAKRLTVSVAGGGAIAIGLFGLMVWLVSNDNAGLDDSASDEPIQFIQYDEEPETRTKDRSDKPEEPPDPPPPPDSPEPVAQQQSQMLDAMPEMDMPNMNVDMGGGGGPFVGNFSSGEAGFDSDATPVSRVPPQYPRKARSDGVEGYVTLEFTIRPDGSVSNISVVRSHPQGTFEQAARRALSRWKFEAKEEGGRKVSRRARQTIRFTLDAG